MKNQAICGSWTDELDLDDQPIAYATHGYNCDWASEYFPNVNQGPFAVRGGRHQLTGWADIYWQVATDYAFRPFPWTGQYVWSPMPLPKRVLVAGLAPPVIGYFPHPNCDGYEMIRARPIAWVVSEIAVDPASDCDLVLYTDPWHGGGTGFSVEAARSTQPAGQLDFVVGASSTSAGSVFPAVIRGAPGAEGPYDLTWTDSAGQRDSTDDASWTGSLGSGRFAQVYEAWLDAGVPVHVELQRLGGAEDIAFAVFASTPGGAWSRAQAEAQSTQLADPDADSAAVTPEQTGRHPIVVYLAQSAASNIAVSYALTVRPLGTLAVVAGPTPLFLSEPAPNPATSRARFTYGLPAEGPARLTIYDLLGRRVRTLVEASVTAGRHVAEWDLRDAEGARVGAGIYWARFETAGRSVVRRVAMVR